MKMKHLDSFIVTERFQFIGVSPYLKIGAVGHHESFHKAFFQGCLSHKQIENPVYLGSRKSGSVAKSWYEPTVPSRLTSRLKVMDIRFFKKLLELTNVNDLSYRQVFIAYEGNLFTVFIFSALLRVRPKLIAIINIFDNQKVITRLKSSYKKLIYMKLFNIALKGINHRMIITGDSARFAKKLEESIGHTVETFPMFSSIKPEKNVNQKASGYLINLRGDRSAIKLLEACNKLDDRTSPKILVHGPIRDSISTELSKLKSIEFNKGHISVLEYERLFQDFKNIIFLYEPSIFSYCSSGRLCDAVVSNKNVFVPKDTALEDFSNVHGNCQSFDFENSSSLSEILRGVSEVSERRPASLPTVENAISSLITVINKRVPVNERKLSGLVFWPTAIVGWLISSLGYYMSAVLLKIRS